MALVGLVQTLTLEGEKRNVRVNCLAPTAATGMTAGVLPAEALARSTPERVSPGLIALADDDAATRMILLAGAGGCRQLRVRPHHDDTSVAHRRPSQRGRTALCSL